MPVPNRWGRHKSKVVPGYTVQLGSPPGDVSDVLERCEVGPLRWLQREALVLESSGVFECGAGSRVLAGLPCEPLCPLRGNLATL